MRRHPVAKLLVIVVALVGLVAIAWWATSTPQWALYRLQRALIERDLTTFRRFVDTEALVHNGVAELMDEAATTVWGAPRPDDVWRGIGRRLTDEALDALKPELQSWAVTAVNDQLQRRWLALTDPGRNVPHVELVRLDRQGAIAKVTIRLSGADEPVGFTMVEDGQLGWRVVRLDTAFMKQLIRMARDAAAAG